MGIVNYYIGTIAFYYAYVPIVIYWAGIIAFYHNYSQLLGRYYCVTL